MALLQTFEKTGNFLFKYRGQIPVFIFLIGLPIVYFTNYKCFFTALGQEKIFFSLVIPIIAVLISLAGFVVRAYTIGTTPRGTSGRNTDKQVAKQLNTTGIYSIVRHPLYLGNYLMWAGLLVFTANIYLIIIVSLVFWLYYERIMFAEEAYLNSQFGEEFISWSQKVPAFIPAFGKFKKGEIPFSMKAVLRREYTGVFAMVFAYTIIDYWMAFAMYKQMPLFNPQYEWCRPSLIVLAAFFLLMIVLRTLKHHTSLLNAETNRD